MCSILIAIPAGTLELGIWGGAEKNAKVLSLGGKSSKTLPSPGKLAKGSWEEDLGG